MSKKNPTPPLPPPKQHGSPIAIMNQPKRRITSAIMVSFAIKTQ
jgi:hypothetical protein